MPLNVFDLFSIRAGCKLMQASYFFFLQPSIVSQSTDSTDSISADPDSILDIKKRLERIKNNSRNWQALLRCSTWTTGKRKIAFRSLHWQIHVSLGRTQVRWKLVNGRLWLVLKCKGEKQATHYSTETLVLCIMWATPAKNVGFQQKSSWLVFDIFLLGFPLLNQSKSKLDF